MIHAKRKTLYKLRETVGITFLSLEAGNKRSAVKLKRKISRILECMQPGDLLLIDCEKMRRDFILTFDFQEVA